MIIVPCTFNSLWRDLWWNFVFFAFFGIGYVLQKERIKILSWHSLVLITVLSILPIQLLHSMSWNLDEKLVKFFKNKLYVGLVVNGTHYNKTKCNFEMPCNATKYWWLSLGENNNQQLFTKMEGNTCFSTYPTEDKLLVYFFQFTPKWLEVKLLMYNFVSSVAGGEWYLLFTSKLKPISMC